MIRKRGKRITLLTNKFPPERVGGARVVPLPLAGGTLSSSHSNSSCGSGRSTATSTDTVGTQIWIAISTYVLVAILKKHLQTEGSLYPMFTGSER